MNIRIINKKIARVCLAATLLLACQSSRPIQQIGTIEQLYEFIADGGPVVVKFARSQCSTCGAMNKLFTRFAQMYATLIKFANVGIKNTPEIAQHFSVKTIPMLIFFKDGIEAQRVPHIVLTEQFKTLIKELFDIDQP
ncbi:thioredoxin family protein [Candidatus Dependentiae bacterium]|nr:thioredoxin family protein [Candidatus Dependentiae bacterium]